MNSEQPVPPISVAPTQPAVADEANPIVAALLARTRWMQRALTPWTQRWLAQAAESADSPSVAGGRRGLSIALTAGAAEQTLSRVQAQYQSYASHAVPGDTGALPLAGAPPQPAVGPAESELGEALDDASLEVKPAARRTQGPYSKPFNSMAEFLKAVEAAKARNYEPPPPEEIAPPPPPREAGPYSHAFTSFEEFVKAVEESRRQSGYTAPQEDEPKPTAPPRGKIRPMSRVEELPARASAVQSDIPVSPPQTAPQLDESFSTPDRLPPAPAAAETSPSPSDLATPAPAQPAVIPPFSPVKARGGTGTKANGPQPPSRKTVAATELPEPIESLPPASPASIVPPSERVPVTAEAAAEPGLPFVPQPTVEFAPSIAPEALPAHVPITTRPSTEPPPTRSTRSLPPQRSTSEPGTPNALPGSTTPAAPGATSASAIQRAVAEMAQDSSTPSEVESAPVSQAQRLMPESAALPITQASPNPIEPSAPQGPVATTASQVQRQVSDPSTSTAMPEISGEEVDAQPLTPAASAPARSDLPLVQRQTTEQPSTSADQAAASSQIQAVPSQPVVQRHVSEPPTSTVAPEISGEEIAGQPVMPATSTPAPNDLPQVQRQTVEQAPTSTAKAVASSQSPATPSQPVVQRQVSEPPTSTVAPEISGEEIAAQPVMPAASAPARSDLPLVQRQTAEKQLTATTPQPVTADAKSTASPQTQMVSTQPVVVQRQVSEPPTSTVAPEISGEEIAAQPVMPVALTQTRSALPQAQRQSAEQPLTATAPQPVTADDKVVASSQIQATPSQPVVQRQTSEPPTSTVAPEISGEEVAAQPLMPAASTTTRSDLPLAQRQTAEQASTATAPQPITSGDKAVASSQIQAAPSQPVVQRQTSERPTFIDQPEAAGDHEALVAPIGPEVAPIRSGRGGPPVQAVQRHTVESESALSEVPAISAPARVEMPFVQRHMADVAPIETEPIQPRSDAPVHDQAANISERILARVASHETVPAARLPALPLHQPVVQRVNAPEVKGVPQPVTSQSVSAAPVMPAPAPLRAPVIQRRPEPVIQRTPAEPAAPSSGSGLIQRVDSAPVETPQASADLDTLARQVYPIIKHLLAIERDRRMSR